MFDLCFGNSLATKPAMHRNVSTEEWEDAVMRIVNYLEYYIADVEGTDKQKNESSSELCQSYQIDEQAKLGVYEENAGENSGLKQ